MITAGNGVFCYYHPLYLSLCLAMGPQINAYSISLKYAVFQAYWTFTYFTDEHRIYKYWAAFRLSNSYLNPCTWSWKSSIKFANFKKLTPHIWSSSIPFCLSQSPYITPEFVKKREEESKDHQKFIHTEDMLTCWMAWGKCSQIWLRCPLIKKVWCQ